MIYESHGFEWTIRAKHRDHDQQKKTYYDTTQLDREGAYVMLLRNAENWNAIPGPFKQDPPLSDFGRNQTELLAHEVQNTTSKPDLIIVSPLRRAVQTAFIAFKHWIVDKNVTVVLMPDVRESAGGQENAGTPTGQWIKEWCPTKTCPTNSSKIPNPIIEDLCDWLCELSQSKNFGFVNAATKEDWDKSAVKSDETFAETPDQIQNRMNNFQNYMNDQRQNHGNCRIAVVSHDYTMPKLAQHLHLGKIPKEFSMDNDHRESSINIVNAKPYFFEW